MAYITDEKFFIHFMKTASKIKKTNLSLLTYYFFINAAIGQTFLKEETFAPYMADILTYLTEKEKQLISKNMLNLLSKEK